MKEALYFSRRKFFGLIAACVIFQLGLSTFILVDQINNGEVDFALIPPTIEVGFARFVAAMVLHIIINDEIFNGLKTIKYSVNHPWKFSNPKMAFAAGFL